LCRTLSPQETQKRGVNENSMKKAVGNLGVTLAIVLMVAAVATYLAPHFGWRVDAVCSGSMEPQLKVGAVVVTHSVEPEAIAVGDIITFRPTTVGENLISHRVIGVEEHSPVYFKTKGDANSGADPFIVPARNVVGKICLHVPFLGYATQFLKTPLGFVFALVLPGLLIVAIYVKSIWQVLAKNGNKRTDKGGQE